MPWPQDDTPAQPQLTPGVALWNYLKNSIPSQLGAAGQMAQGAAQPFANLFGLTGQQPTFLQNPTPESKADMGKVLASMYAGAAAPGAGAADAAGLNVGINLRRNDRLGGMGVLPYEHGYEMLSKKTGEPLGSLILEKNGPNVHISNVGALGGPQSIGPDGIRDVVQQLKSIYPDATAIEGNRVSGARHGGAYNDEIEPEDAPLASVRLRPGPSSEFAAMYPGMGKTETLFAGGGGNPLLAALMGLMGQQPQGQQLASGSPAPSPAPPASKNLPFKTLPLSWSAKDPVPQVGPSALPPPQLSPLTSPEFYSDLLKQLGLPSGQ
jgi:hypothetical protein